LERTVTRQLAIVVVVLSLALLGAITRVFPAVAATAWSTTGSMTIGRWGHTATLLPSGQVLVAGGMGTGTSFLSSAELYDPVTGGWRATGPMTVGRRSHTATLLPSGKVLVAGGCCDGGAVLISAEVYDPVAGTWSPTRNMTSARSSHTATLLPSGKVLAAGWDASAELYDPESESWNPTGSMHVARVVHTATLLPLGKVLVAGGCCDSSGMLDSAELYDPLTATWSETGNMAVARHSHTETLLPSGRVLVAGGSGHSGFLSSAELYDPVGGTWSAAQGMAETRAGHTATLLATGTVLVAGGGFSGGTRVSAELYDTASGRWSATGNMANAREGHTAALLSSGSVLVAGGSGAGLQSAELYASSAATPPLHSLALNGTTAYAEAPDAAKLNLTGDWTVETWFKDETAGGYNHPFAKLVAKADRNASPEVTYMIVIGNNVLRAGVQHNNVSIYAEADLATTTANAWHHVAAAFTRSTANLTVYLDGVQVAEQTLGVLSDGNTVPVGMGRGGSGGYYFTGKLDDVRIWNTSRTASEIAANMAAEFSSAPAGLIANWKFDEASGTTAADSTPAPDNATLNGGATFSTDVHP
jgi:hypothetical protein